MNPRAWNVDAWRDPSPVLQALIRLRDDMEVELHLDLWLAELTDTTVPELMELFP